MYFTDDEIRQFRSDTPGCLFKVHLNNAGASLMPLPVIDAINRHISLEGNIGGYEASDYRAGEIDKFYQSAGKLFSCDPVNIAFTANATDSFSRAISSIDFKPGDVILTSNEDYISNQITYLAFSKRFGVKLIRAKSEEGGGIDLKDFEKCIRTYHPKLVAITHIPTNSGLVQPVKEIGEICSRYELLYLLDACQSVGQMGLDVNDLKCDFLSVTSRKFLRGPRGAGFLYVSDKALDMGLEPLFIDMRGADWVSENEYAPRKGSIRFEDWEFAYALVLGTGAAIDYLLTLSIDNVEKQVKFLANYARNELSTIDRVSVYDKGQDPGGIVSFHLKGSNPEFIKDALSKKNINVATSYRRFAVIDFDEKQIGWTVRVSPHYFNTIEEIDYFLETVKQL